MKDKELIKLIPPDYLLSYDVDSNLLQYGKMDIKIVVSGKITFGELQPVIEAAKLDKKNNIQLVINYRN